MRTEEDYRYIEFDTHSHFSSREKDDTPVVIVPLEYEAARKDDDNKGPTDRRHELTNSRHFLTSSLHQSIAINVNKKKRKKCGHISLHHR